MTFSVSVQEQDFDVGDEYKSLAVENSAGAIVFFVGRVRDINEAHQVKSLELQHYSGMTERALESIMNDAKERWELIAARIVHRVGRLCVADQIVFVGVASMHREQAFQAAQFLMDYLKTRAPFWKKEITDTGELWIEAQSKDEIAANRW